MEKSSKKKTLLQQISLFYTSPPYIRLDKLIGCRYIHNVPDITCMSVYHFIKRWFSRLLEYYTGLQDNSPWRMHTKRNAKADAANFYHLYQFVYPLDACWSTRRSVAALCAIANTHHLNIVLPAKQAKQGRKRRANGPVFVLLSGSYPF